MGQSYRIRTTPGDDKNIVIQVDQDFEQLEILSLKIRQEDVYDRMCSDYGVIAGRVYANNGYGIPNAKVTIFIPVTDEDLLNPNISAIYPFKNLEQTNEDGYRFNILPYSPSYDGHVATGTFPTRLDVLNNQTVSYLYNKYYQYTVTTNDSGDYMIFGVPVGNQTIVMNVDLSDIGSFSLTPQDLIRMGIATDGDFDGVKFKKSPNFYILPQIVVINKTIEIVPFWGQPETCQIGITRSDFDLTSDANIEIKPTSIFMGSLMSSNEKTGVSYKGVAKKTTGDLCKMVAGPGEIIAITQTIDLDSDGLPILERASLPNSGKLIDENGTWMFDLPMNLDFVYTNEYGELVLSNNPKVGVPTRGKYRFKIKWQQSKNLNEDYKRGYFIVPNIREKGWDTNNPDVDPLNGGLGILAYEKAQKSYAFSLNWSSYTTNFVSASNQDIIDAINCEDTFYDFDYNKVYTISQLIDNEKIHRNRERFIGIKRIEEDTCEDTSNRYPVNDAVLHTTVSYLIFNLLITLMQYFLMIFLPAYHILRLVVDLLYYIIKTVICGILSILELIPFIRKKIKKIKEKLNCGDYNPPLGPWRLPMITYPDCDTCSCDGTDDEGNPNVTEPTSPPLTNQTSSSSAGLFAEINNVDFYTTEVTSNFSILFPGFLPTDINPVIQVLAGEGVVNYNGVRYITNQLPFGERINSYNVKGKYYNDNGGLNQISIKYAPTIPTNTSYHNDNTLTFIVPTSSLDSFSSGTMFTLVDPTTSVDPNVTGATINGYATNNTTGTTTYPGQVTISYGDPSNRLNNLSTIYNLPTNFTDTLLYVFPSDIEYYQVITGLTINDFLNISNATPINGSFADILKGDMTITKSSPLVSQTIKLIDVINPNDYSVLIVQRGVDPYSPLYNTEVRLGKIFGYNTTSNVGITADLRLNVPVKNIDTTIGGVNNDLILFRHDLAATNNSVNNGQKLFFPSYFFQPSTSYISYITKFHNFYSRLDSSLVTIPPPVFVSNPISSYINNIVFNNTIDITPKTINRYFSSIAVNNDSNYSNNESLAGGSYLMGTATTDYRFSPIYPLTNMITMSDRQKIVMRSDRLPASQTITTTNENTDLLQQNNDASVFLVTSYSSVTYNTSVGSEQYGDNYDPNFSADTNGLVASVFDSFDCAKMKSLKCYQGEGLTFTINPFCPEYDLVQNGCYTFVKIPISDLPKDFLNMFEYTRRLKFFYQLCQGTLSSVFNNNWINGNLYAFPFKIRTYYNRSNQVSSRVYPKRVVVLHNETNNFYYRSSPYDISVSKFIGGPSQSRHDRGANFRNLKTPTTIMNLGPKDILLKSLVLNGNFDGYLINKLLQTSYNDLDDLVNYYAFIRITSGNFIQQIFGGAISIKKLFNRPGQRIDGDFAQVAAINTQIGIIPFDGDVYSSALPNPSVVSIPSGNLFTIKRILGVYFSSTTEDIQLKDYLSPGRTLRPGSTTTFPCDILGIKSQIVPHYRWNIDNGDTMWGTVYNNWATSTTDIVQNIKYQKLDRRSSGYPIDGSISDDYNIRGYLYNVDVNGNYQTLPNATPNPALGGAPWYFYFGLTKGKTAINRFFTAYIGETNLNE